MIIVTVPFSLGPVLGNVIRKLTAAYGRTRIPNYKLSLD